MSTRAAGLALVLVSSVALVGFTVVRDVGDDGPILWADPTLTVEIQQDGSDDVTDGSDLEALRAALATWNAVPCSRLRFVDGGTGTSRSIGRDGVNRIAFLESAWPGYAAGAGAFTVRERDEGTPDRWVDFDILVNGQDARWSTSGLVALPDIQSAVVHELGHGLGLQHASDPRASMFYSVRLGTTFARSLHADDVAGVCFLYPAQAFSCATDDACPAVYGQYGGGNLRMSCQAGMCREGPASTYGATCFEANDCTSGTCLVDPTRPPSSEPGACSLDCTTAACPDGEYCSTTPGGPRCVIGRVDCAVDADCGGMPRVCARQLDGRFQCQRLCLRDAQCATIPGAVCHGGTGANPAGFCRVPGAGGLGASCVSGLDCASLTCLGSGDGTTCGPAPGVVAPPSDAGVPAPDAAAQADAAPPGADARPGDAGVRADVDAPVGNDASAAVSPDAASGAGADAGAAGPRLVGGELGGGCACVVPRRASGGELVVGLLALGGAWRRRRARRA